MTVDYGLNCSEVFVKVAQRLIAAGNLDTFAIRERTQSTIGTSSTPIVDGGREGDIALPSWAPNWSKSIVIPSPWWNTRYKDSGVLGNRLFSASADTIANVVFGTSYDD